MKLKLFLMPNLPQTVRRGRVFAPKVHQRAAPSFVSVSHLFGQVMQALVVLRMRNRAVFEEDFQGGHLPVVECPALFLRGQGLRCIVRRVHRATVLPAAGIVPCCCAAFSAGSKSVQILHKVVA